MSSKHVCRACMRELRRQTPQRLFSHPNSLVIPTAQQRQPVAIRRFSNVSKLNASSLPRRPPPPSSSAVDASDLSGSTPAGQLVDGLDPALSPQKQRKDTGSSTASMQRRIVQGIVKAAPSATAIYQVYGSTDSMYQVIQEATDYDVPQAEEREVKGGAEVPRNRYGEEEGVPHGTFYKALELTPTFNTWAQLTMLHMYVLTARMRQLSVDEHKLWSQNLTDHFFYDAEYRMDTFHAVAARSLRQRYLKDLFVQYRGITAAYDEALVRGDAWLAAAVWRNVWKAAGSEVAAKGELRRDDVVDWVRVAMVVSWVRRMLERFERMSDRDFLRGDLEWATLDGETQGVLMKYQVPREV